MKRSTLNRRLAMWPAEILDNIADERTWHADDATVTIKSNRAEGLDLRASMPLPGNRIPGAARRFLGADAKVSQRIRAAPVAETDTLAVAGIDAEVPGLPLDVHVEITLTRLEGEVTDVHAVIETACSLPFVGAAIEAGAHPHIEDMIASSLDRLSAS